MSEKTMLDMKLTMLTEQTEKNDKRLMDQLTDIAAKKAELSRLEPALAGAEASRDERGQRIKELEEKIESLHESAGNTRYEFVKYDF